MPGGINLPRHFIFFSSFFLIFVFSLSPTVYPGDSSLFTAAAYFLGSAHPPAYPFYLLIGKLITFIPFGNIALKVNLLSAVFGALAALLSYEAALYLTKNPAVSFFAPLTVLASPSFVLESSKAEVYGFNSFLVICIFYLGIRSLKEEGFYKNVLLSAFILGIGMGNHHTIGFMLFTVLYVVVIRRKDLPFGMVAFSIILFIAGFSVYFYLYLRSIVGTFISYSPVLSFIDFIKVFLRADYSSNTLDAVKMVSSHDIGWMYALRNLWVILSRDIYPVTWFFVIAGMAGAFRERRVFGYLLVSLMIWLFLARMTMPAKELSYKAIDIISVYYLQMIPILGIIAAAGLSVCYEKLKEHSALISKALVTALIIFQMVYVSISIQKSSVSDYSIAYNWIKDISVVIKPKSFFLAFGDNPSFLGFYGLGVERLRDDVVYMDAGTNDNNFRLILAPSPKFSIWYPDFYESEGTSVKYFYPLAEKYRLYASSAGSLPENIRNKFDVRGYVLTTILLNKGSSHNVKELFREEFKKINYLPVLTGSTDDVLAAEIIGNYMLTVWHYAELLAAEDSKDTDYFYKVAIFLAKQREMKYDVIRGYLGFLYEKRGTKPALEFIDELKGSVNDMSQKNYIEGLEKSVKQGSITLSSSKKR